MTVRVTLSAVALGFAVSLLAPVAAAAQPPGVQNPPRDARPAATGTAIIRGRITAGDTGQPLRRARIRLIGAELGTEGRTTSTNLDGRYELKDLPAGRYTLQVNRSGYLPLNYGQRRPLEQGKPLQVEDKGVLEHVDFALPRTSVITGRIVDELGEPVGNALVFAMRSIFFQGRRRVAPVTSAQTDDAGQFRLSGLSPGSYYVMALMRDTWTVTENGVDTLMGYENTYFPGTPGLTNARRVTVALGQEAAATDIMLIPGRSATVSGTAFDSTGRPLTGRSVNLGVEVRGPQMSVGMGGPQTTVRADGTFMMKDVPPGEYKMRTQTTVEGRTPGQQATEAAIMPIVVDGTDLTNLSLTTTAGWVARGTVVNASGAPLQVPTAQVRIAAQPVDVDTAPTNVAGFGLAAADSGRVSNDWTFVVSPIFAASRFSVTVPDGWALQAIVHDGADITDRTVEMRSGEEVRDLQVIITDRVTTVTAQITDDRGAPTANGTLIVFPEDSEKWTEDSRWVRSARADQQGQFRIRGLPAGAYLAVAVDYVENSMWNDPEYLESLRAYGQRFRLEEAASQSLLLKVVAP